jgi:hypothetical protein
VCSRRPSQIDLFVTRNDPPTNSMYHRVWEADAGWGGKEELGGGAPCIGVPAAAAWRAGGVVAIGGLPEAIHLFVDRGGVLQHQVWEGRWLGWNPVVPMARSGGIAACSWGPGRVDCFGVNTHQPVGSGTGLQGGGSGSSLTIEEGGGFGNVGSETYHIAGDGSEQRGWPEPEPLGGFSISVPAAVAWPDHLDVSIIGRDGGLYRKWQDGGGPWSADWTPFGDDGHGNWLVCNCGVGVCSRAEGLLDVFAVEDGSQQMVHVHWNGHRWSTEWLPGAQFTCSHLVLPRFAPPAAVARDINRLDVFAVEDGVVMRNTWGPPFEP